MRQSIYTIKKVIMLIAISLLITSCSQISTEDYNKVIEENKNLKSQIEDVQDKNKEISDKLDKLLNELQDPSSSSGDKNLSLDELLETSSTDMAEMLSDLLDLTSNANLNTADSAQVSMHKIKVLASNSSLKMSDYIKDFEEISDSRKKQDLYVDYAHLLNTVYNMFLNLSINLENATLGDYNNIISKATTEMNTITKLTNDIVDKYY